MRQLGLEVLPEVARVFKVSVYAHGWRPLNPCDSARQSSLHCGLYGGGPDRSSKQDLEEGSVRSDVSGQHKHITHSQRVMCPEFLMHQAPARIENKQTNSTSANERLGRPSSRTK